MVFSFLVTFLLVLLILLLLSKLISRWFLELLGDRCYAILLWPVVVVHELSHLLGALLTFTRVTGFSLWPQSMGAGGRVLGSVTHEASRNPVTLILISAFPVLGGSFILWLIAWLLLPDNLLTAPTINLSGGVWAILWNYLINWWRFALQFLAAFSMTAWQSWLFLYMALAVAAHLSPSNHDLGYTAAGFTALSILTVLLVWGGQLINQPVGNQLAEYAFGAVKFFMPLLSYALAVLLLAILFVGLLVGIKRLNQRQVWW